MASIIRPPINVNSASTIINSTVIGNENLNRQVLDNSSMIRNVEIINSEIIAPSSVINQDLPLDYMLDIKNISLIEVDGAVGVFGKSMVVDNFINELLDPKTGMSVIEHTFGSGISSITGGFMMIGLFDKSGNYKALSAINDQLMNTYREFTSSTLSFSGFVVKASELLKDLQSNVESNDFNTTEKNPEILRYLSKIDLYAKSLSKLIDHYSQFRLEEYYLITNNVSTAVDIFNARIDSEASEVIMDIVNRQIELVIGEGGHAYEENLYKFLTLIPKSKIDRNTASNILESLDKTPQKTTETYTTLIDLFKNIY